MHRHRVVCSRSKQDAPPSCRIYGWSTSFCTCADRSEATVARFKVSHGCSQCTEPDFECFYVCARSRLEGTVARSKVSHGGSQHVPLKSPFCTCASPSEEALARFQVSHGYPHKVTSFCDLQQGPSLSDRQSRVFCYFWKQENEYNRHTIAMEAYTRTLHRRTHAYRSMTENSPVYLHAPCDRQVCSTRNRGTRRQVIAEKPVG